MNKDDILRAARGHELRQSHLFVVSVADGRFELETKEPINAKEDLVISVVQNKEDIALTDSDKFSDFVGKVGGQLGK